MPVTRKRQEDKCPTFIDRQKWDANLAAEESLVAMQIMERLGFERRTDFIRFALTNPVLLEQNSGFEAVERVATQLTELREYLVNSGCDDKFLKRMEQRLRDIYATVQAGVSTCPGRF